MSQYSEIILAPIYRWIIQRGEYLLKQKTAVAAETLARDAATTAKTEQRKNAKQRRKDSSDE